MGSFAQAVEYQNQSTGYPVVNRDVMKYGPLAASHLNTVLRCFEQCLVSVITGKTFLMGGTNHVYNFTCNVASDKDGGVEK